LKGAGDKGGMEWDGMAIMDFGFWDQWTTEFVCVRYKV